MENAVYAVAALTVILLAAALLVVWSRRDIPQFRGMSIGLAIVAALGSAGAIGSTLGHPVPFIAGITAPEGEVGVLSVKSIVNRGIFFTLDLPAHPKLFWLPWDRDLAEKLQEMMNNGGAIASLPPFEWSWDTSPPSFSELPQPKWMPDKADEPKPAAPHFNA